jgi:copper(I)-binding protein
MSKNRHLAIALAISCLTLAPVAAAAHDHGEAAGGPLAEIGDLIIGDGFARAVGPRAQSGAGYFTVTNEGDEPDILVAAESPAAERVEIHTHVLDETGVARMVELAEGIEIPAGETVTLEPGGLHVMFMGLTDAWDPEAGIAVTLVFAEAGEVEIVLPVAAAPGHHHGNDDHHGHCHHDHDEDHDEQAEPHEEGGARN